MGQQSMMPRNPGETLVQYDARHRKMVQQMAIREVNSPLPLVAPTLPMELNPVEQAALDLVREETARGDVVTQIPLPELVKFLVEHFEPVLLPKSREWQPMETAPKDRPIEVLASESPMFSTDLPAIESECQWHPDAGFCVDEIRVARWWREL